jgi:hypothetical protein
MVMSEVKQFEPLPSEPLARARKIRELILDRIEEIGFWRATATLNSEIIAELHPEITEVELEKWLYLCPRYLECLRAGNRIAAEECGAAMRRRLFELYNQTSDEQLRMKLAQIAINYEVALMKLDLEREKVRLAWAKLGGEDDSVRRSSDEEWVRSGRFRAAPRGGLV